MRNISPAETSVPRIAPVVHQLGRKRWGTVTLTANAASTVVDDPTVTPDSIILLIATTANGAAAGAATPWLLATPSMGSFTIAHANNAQTDRTFKWVALGD